MSLDEPSSFVKHQTVTRDRFLGGRLVLAQPSRGFRAGLDSVLLGAAVAPRVRSVLDLGAGVGTAALVALAGEEDRTAMLLDSDPHMLALAAENIAANGFSGRAATLEADVADAAKVLSGARFDAVIANPPFFAAGSGTAASVRGRAARHMPAGSLETWARAAAGALAARGEAIFVLPATALAEILAALTPRLGGITILPFTPRPGGAASRILVRGRAGSRAALTLLPARSLHGPSGSSFAPDVAAILEGRKRADW